jgi:hypothetical protein
MGKLTRITWAMEKIMAEELSCTVDLDDTARHVCKLFDYAFDGVSRFSVPEMAAVPEGFGIGLIVGPSGSGKSSLLRRHFAQPQMPEWLPNRPIVSHFADAKMAYERLGAVGLNSIPSWMRPYHVLSKSRAERPLTNLRQSWTATWLNRAPPRCADTSPTRI